MLNEEQTKQTWKVTALWHRQIPYQFFFLDSAPKKKFSSFEKDNWASFKQTLTELKGIHIFVSLWKQDLDLNLASISSKFLKSHRF